jgi:hypothetical protein
VTRRVVNCTFRFRAQNWVSGINLGSSDICNVRATVWPCWIENIEIRSETTCGAINAVWCWIIY